MSNWLTYAFHISGRNQLISVENVLKLNVEKNKEKTSELIIGFRRISVL